MADELIALFGKITTNDHEQLIEQFSKILQVQSNVATFFLEASSWNVETAVHNYLASVGNNRGPVLTSPPRAQFLGDLSPLHNRTFPGDTRLSLRLTFRNIGSDPWPGDTRLSFVDGEMMDGPANIRVAAPPGADAVICLELTSPPDSGTYMGSWRLACNAGYFGEPVYIIVTVDKRLPAGQQMMPQQTQPAFGMQVDAMQMGNNTNPGMNAVASRGANGKMHVEQEMASQQQLQFGSHQGLTAEQQQQQQQQQEDTDMIDL